MNAIDLLITLTALAVVPVVALAALAAWMERAEHHNKRRD